MLLELTACQLSECLDLTISLKKTEVLHQFPPQGTYHPPHMSTDGILLDTVEHFTYLGSVTSSDATVAT
ncbi:hypothetical protein ACOMHN_063715 [Nucella lapillus]